MAVSILGNSADTLSYYKDLYVLSGSRFSDHGELTGLTDDDHSQYHNDTRGDSRYYTKTNLQTSEGAEVHWDNIINKSTFSSTENGLVPTSGEETDTFLKADGTWAIPYELTVPGSDSYVIYNSSGELGASSYFYYTAATGSLTIGGANTTDRGYSILRNGLSFNMASSATNNEDYIQSYHTLMSMKLSSSCYFTEAKENNGSALGVFSFNSNYTGWTDTLTNPFMYWNDYPVTTSTKIRKTFKMSIDGTERAYFYPRVTSSGSAVAYMFDTAVNLSTSGDKLFSVKNYGTEKFYIDKDGNAYSNGTLLGLSSANVIAGTYSAGQVTFWDSTAYTIAGDSDFIWNTSTSILTVSGTVYATELYDNTLRVVRSANIDYNALSYTSSSAAHTILTYESDTTTFFGSDRPTMYRIVIVGKGYHVDIPINETITLKVGGDTVATVVIPTLTYYGTQYRIIFEFGPNSGADTIYCTTSYITSDATCDMAYTTHSIDPELLSDANIVVTLTSSSSSSDAGHRIYMNSIELLNDNS